MGFESSYLYAGPGQLQAWGADQAPLIEYGYEEINNLISDVALPSNHNTVFVHDDQTAGGSRFRAQGRGRVGMYQF